MDVTAAVLRGADAPFTIETVEIEEPRSGEVLVRLVASGMCHTDLSMRDVHRATPYPVVLGHEGSGVIEAVGPGVTDLVVGQPVALSFASCGACPSCSTGDATYCDDMWSLNFDCRRADGTVSLNSGGENIGSHYFGQSSFATHALVGRRGIVALPDDAPLELVGPLGCGFQTGAGAVLNVFRAPAGSTMAVFGCGAVGLAAIMAGAAAGCSTIIGVDLHAARLDVAETMGATSTIEPSVGSEADLAAQILELTSGRGVDFSFDTTGVGSVFEAAVNCLAPRGTCGLVAAGPPGDLASVSQRHLMFGRSIRGIIEGDSVPSVFIPQLLELHRQGRFPFDELITTFPLSEINAAEAASLSGDVIKPVLVMP